MNLVRRISFSLALLCLAVLPAFAEDIKNIRPTGYVTDLADVISPQTKSQLESLCTELQQKTGAQMAVVTVRSLEGDTAAQFANDLFKQLGIGAKKEDNGVLLLVAPSERKYWTEVGYGLEPVINDARAGDAGRTMIPYFRKGDFSGGILAAAWQLAGYIADEKGVTLSGRPEIRKIKSDSDDNPIGVLIFVVIIFVLIWAFSKSNTNTRGRGGRGSNWWIGPTGGGAIGSGWGGGGFGGSSGGWSSGGGFGGFGGGGSGGGGAGGSW